jgi:hypothetical protein
MTPKAPARSAIAEEALAHRVKVERERRQWSPAGLAARMTSAGCPLTQSSIWKIENGQPRRRITFDEAVGFARVFDIPLEDLALPPEVQEAEEAAFLVRAIRERAETVERARTDAEELVQSLLVMLEKSSDVDLVASAAARAVDEGSGNFDPRVDREMTDRLKDTQKLRHPSRSWGAREELLLFVERVGARLRGEDPKHETQQNEAQQENTDG